MGRFLGIDYGRARIGIAYSDESKMLSSPLGFIQNQKNPQATFSLIREAIQRLGTIELLVIGLPLLLNGTEGPMAAEARAFGEALSSYLSISCSFWDERLSSSFADKLMKEGDLSRKKRSSLSDSFSATLTLQNYLDFYGRNKK